MSSHRALSVSQILVPEVRLLKELLWGPLLTHHIGATDAIDIYRQRPALPVLDKWTLAMSQTGRRDPLSSRLWGGHTDGTGRGRR